MDLISFCMSIRHLKFREQMPFTVLHLPLVLIRATSYSPQAMSTMPYPSARQHANLVLPIFITLHICIYRQTAAVCSLVSQFFRQSSPLYSQHTYHISVHLTDRCRRRLFVRRLYRKSNFILLRLLIMNNS